MIETALVFGEHGITVHWHAPLDRQEGAIPDSRDLWTILWENRETIWGVAHTHPWFGEAWPSNTDVTTFSAVERGLGKRLLWPIVTFTTVQCFGWNPVTESYVPVKGENIELLEVGKLRELSKGSSQVGAE